MESLKVLSIEKGNKDSKDFAIPCYRYTTTISVFSPTIIEDTLLKILKELNGNIERVAENLLLKKELVQFFVTSLSNKGVLDENNIPINKDTLAPESNKKGVLDENNTPINKDTLAPESNKKMIYIYVDAISGEILPYYTDKDQQFLASKDIEKDIIITKGSAGKERARHLKKVGRFPEVTPNLPLAREIKQVIKMVSQRDELKMVSQRDELNMDISVPEGAPNLPLAQEIEPVIKSEDVHDIQINEEPEKIYIHTLGTFNNDRHDIEIRDGFCHVVSSLYKKHIEDNSLSAEILQNSTSAETAPPSESESNDINNPLGSIHLLWKQHEAIKNDTTQKGEAKITIYGDIYKKLVLDLIEPHFKTLLRKYPLSPSDIECKNILTKYEYSRCRLVGVVEKVVKSMDEHPKHPLLHHKEELGKNFFKSLSEIVKIKNDLQHNSDSPQYEPSKCKDHIDIVTEFIRLIMEIEKVDIPFRPYIIKSIALAKSELLDALSEEIFNKLPDHLQDELIRLEQFFGENSADQETLKKIVINLYNCADIAIFDYLSKMFDDRDSRKEVSSCTKGDIFNRAISNFKDIKKEGRVHNCFNEVSPYKIESTLNGKRQTLGASTLALLYHDNRLLSSQNLEYIQKILIARNHGNKDITISYEDLKKIKEYVLSDIIKKIYKKIA